MCCSATIEIDCSGRQCRLKFETFHAVICCFVNIDRNIDLATIGIDIRSNDNTAVCFQIDVQNSRRGRDALINQNVIIGIQRQRGAVGVAAVSSLDDRSVDRDIARCRRTAARRTDDDIRAIIERRIDAGNVNGCNSISCGWVECNGARIARTGLCDVGIRIRYRDAFRVQ